jgi:hypothetical protein
MPGSRRRPAFNAPLTKCAPTILPSALIAGAAAEAAIGRVDMEFEKFFEKTPATLDEIKNRVAYALERHPLCRNVQFDIVSMPRSSKGGNWTISLQAVASDALWEASEIIADIQDAYELAAAA